MWAAEFTQRLLSFGLLEVGSSGIFSVFIDSGLVFIMQGSVGIHSFK